MRNSRGFILEKPTDWLVSALCCALLNLCVSFHVLGQSNEPSTTFQPVLIGPLTEGFDPTKEKDRSLIDNELGKSQQWDQLSSVALLQSPSVQVEPYWAQESKHLLRASPDRAVVVTLEQLVTEAIAHSPFIQSAQLQPKIVETQIAQAASEFDTKRFVDGVFHSTSDPVGNALTVGNAGNRLNETLMDSGAGIRKRTRSGGRFEGAQELDFRNNNSQFFTPAQQADTKLVFRYTQPLMKGSGVAYNQSSIMIARANTNQSVHEAERRLQQRTLEIAQVYWTLYYQRALYTQLAHGTKRLERLVNQLRGRIEMDALRSQLKVAEAELYKRRAEWAESRTNILTQEARLRSLTQSPWLANDQTDEIVPGTLPLLSMFPVEEQAELEAALYHRPDILAFRNNIRAAKIQYEVAEADLRPTLDLVTDFYVRGLNGQYDVARSLNDQFSQGSPSYSAGLQYLRPKGNRLAQAIRRQRSLEMQKMLFDLDELLTKLQADLIDRMNKCQAAGIKMQAAELTTLATHEEVETLDSKWQYSGLGDATSTSLLLDQLIDAEIRLISAENNWAAEQATYMISLAELDFETGQLLSTQPSETE